MICPEDFLILDESWNNNFVAPQRSGKDGFNHIPQITRRDRADQNERRESLVPTAQLIPRSDQAALILVFGERSGIEDKRSAL